MNLLQQFIDFLINQNNKPSLLTVKNYKADIRQFVIWFEKEFKFVFDPSKINVQILEQYKKSRKLSPSSIERHISSLRKFFNFLKSQQLISSDFLPTQSYSEKIQPDPWKLIHFKNSLREYKKSNLTIKNYINDLKGFFSWLSQVSLTKYAWNVADKNLLNKINTSVIQEYKQRLIESDFSPLTINRKLSSLRSYMSFAKKQGFISPSPEPEYIKNEILPLRQAQGQNDKISYSPLPPIRLAQKSAKGLNIVFDNLFILPLAKGIENSQYLLWKATGKKIFKDNPRSFGLMPQDDITNIKKEFYAPLSISTQYLPRHKRAWHYIRHVRPNWYKKYHSYSITHHLHFAILVLVTSAFGFGLYNGVFADIQKQNPSFAAASNMPPRILSFQGKLSDSQNNPIVKSTDILFSIYNDEKAPENTSLWQETDSVSPDSQGNFSTLLGQNMPIPGSLFSENPKLYLGIKIGNGPELFPRQQLATSQFAGTSETLQGLEPITNSTKISNVVLALDSAGNLSIAGEKAHTFQTIGGQFVLSGKILSLTTIPGSNGNVEIVPDGLGIIDLSKPIQNNTNNNNIPEAMGAVEFDDIVAILATSSAQSAFYINQNSTGPLISASTSSIAKFTVDNDGTGMFAGDLEVNGGDFTSSSTTFDLLTSKVATLNIGGGATINLGSASATLNIKSNLNISKDITLSNFTSNGGILYTNGSGKISQVSAGSTSDCLTGGSSPSFTSCAKILNEATSVGIGTTTPSFFLDVQNSQSSTAAAQIFNTNTGIDADGLVVKLGNTSASASASNHFISFETAGIGVVGSVQGNGATGVTYATSGIADFAEYLKKDKNQTIEYGSVLCLNENGLVAKCDNDNNKIVGVASERPAFLGGENLGNGSIAVGLVGRIETFATILNGKIKAGDMLTSSDIPGVAIKVTKPGQIIGKALEDLSTIDESKIVGYYDPDNKEYRSKADLSNIPLKSNIIPIVKIHALINASWYDPGAYLANNGDLIIHKTGSSGYAVSSQNNETLTNIGGFFEIIAANIKAGFIKASEITTSSLIVTTDSIIVNGQNLKDYIAGIVNETQTNNQEGIISPVLETPQLATNIISPLAPDAPIKINGKLAIENPASSDSAKTDLALEVKGNASISGNLNASDASISGTLRARSILAESIEGLDKFINLASYSAQLAYVEGLQAENAQFNQGLMVFGGTSLLDVSVAGQLSLNGTMFLGDNSLNTLGSDLYIQNLRQGNISIMAGLITIDTDGNLKVSGDVSISGKLAVNIISPLPSSDLTVINASGSGVLSINQSGDVVASGSGTFAKLNFSFVEPAFALSPTELIASSSAGTANISSYQDEVTIKNALITDKSVIYITPVGTPSAQSPFLIRQAGSAFTVGVGAPNKNPIPFNWLIVN